MQPSEQDLSAHFAELNDDALLLSARSVDDLTPLAQDVLRSELARRHLAMPPAEPKPAEPTTLDDQRIVTVRRFRDVSEAIVARSVLEGAGIECFLRNENTVRIDWQISNAIGGIRLDVLESDLEAAEQALMPAEESGGAIDSADSESDTVFPRCGSRNIHRKHRWGGLAMASILTFGIPLPRGKMEWTCDACKARWVEAEAG